MIEDSPHKLDSQEQGLFGSHLNHLKSGEKTWAEAFDPCTSRPNNPHSDRIHKLVLIYLHSPIPSISYPHEDLSFPCSDLNLVPQFMEDIWKVDLDLHVLICPYGPSGWTVSGRSCASCRMGWAAVFVPCAMAEALEPIDYLTVPFCPWQWCEDSPISMWTNRLPQHCPNMSLQEH